MIVHEPNQPTETMEFPDGTTVTYQMRHVPTLELTPELTPERKVLLDGIEIPVLANTLKFEQRGGQMVCTMSFHVKLKADME